MQSFCLLLKVKHALLLPFWPMIYKVDIRADCFCPTIQIALVFVFYRGEHAPGAKGVALPALPL